MTLLQAAKALIALGCLDEPHDIQVGDCFTAKSGWTGTPGIDVQHYCTADTPTTLRRRAENMEFNERRAKECPQAKEDLRKAAQ